jgi:hypothetical protein
MKKKSQVVERQDQGCRDRLLKYTFNTQLHTLRSLKTASKKRRALKRAANNSVLTKSNPSMGGERTQRSA